MSKKAPMLQGGDELRKYIFNNSIIFMYNIEEQKGV